MICNAFFAERRLISMAKSTDRIPALTAAGTFAAVNSASSMIQGPITSAGRYQRNGLWRKKGLISAIISFREDPKGMAAKSTGKKRPRRRSRPSLGRSRKCPALFGSNFAALFPKG
jgi:hypothetical protein